MQKFLPLQDEAMLSALAQYETGKRQYYRPVYSVHKWWERRPGALFRAILLAAELLRVASTMPNPLDYARFEAVLRQFDALQAEFEIARLTANLHTSPITQFTQQLRLFEKPQTDFVTKDAE